MKIVQVIHGYPMRYNAGSEVYTQTLSHCLARKGHQVAIFSRIEDSFQPDYSLTSEVDPEEPRIQLNLVNMANGRDRYLHEGVDKRFGELLNRFQPDVIHVQHLNHLSTSIVRVGAARNIPIVFTLHDYWLMCPRGQFVQIGLGASEPWKLCDGQNDRKCAISCYSRYFSGNSMESDIDMEHWTKWVHDRMEHVREISEMVDTFVAPSEFLMRKFTDEFGMPAKKVVYMDYGFDLNRLAGRKRSKEDAFVFGYIGTQTPQKGINLLIEAFGMLRGEPRLRIWGRDGAQITSSLKKMASSLGENFSSRIEWLPEYRNSNIVSEVFNKVDAIVVPSIWVENSPLVIHESQQARIPVITADTGGMSEYVHHEKNGLLFRHRDSVRLAEQMQRFVDNPLYAEALGKRGYIKSQSGEVPRIENHVDALVQVYRRLQHREVVTVS